MLTTTASACGGLGVAGFDAGSEFCVSLETRETTGTVACFGLASDFFAVVVLATCFDPPELSNTAMSSTRTTATPQPAYNK
jgi:hypothetical protein